MNKKLFRNTSPEHLGYLIRAQFISLEIVKMRRNFDITSFRAFNSQKEEKKKKTKDKEKEKVETPICQEFALQEMGISDKLTPMNTILQVRGE